MDGELELLFVLVNVKVDVFDLFVVCKSRGVGFRVLIFCRVGGMLVCFYFLEKGFGFRCLLVFCVVWCCLGSCFLFFVWW